MNTYNSKYTRKDIEENIDQLKETTSDLSDKVFTNATNISSLQSAIKPLENHLNELDTNLDNLSNSAATKDDLNKLKKEVEDVKKELDAVKVKVDELQGKGSLVELDCDNIYYFLNPDYKYNYINGHKPHDTIFFTPDEMNKMKIGQEIYVFITGDESFGIFIYGGTYIIGQNGEKLKGDGTEQITPENGLVEMSIIKVSEESVFVRLQ